MLGIYVEDENSAWTEVPMRPFEHLLPLREARYVIDCVERTDNRIESLRQRETGDVAMDKLGVGCLLTSDLQHTLRIVYPNALVTPSENGQHTP
jgi:hypothetical protein